MYTKTRAELRKTLDEIKSAGLYKQERLLDSPQAPHVESGDRDLLNFCSNNYLGLANHPDVIAAAKQSLDANGFGMASVRFICGTQTQHDELESRLSRLLGTDATILFPSCFDANGGVFEVLLDQGDAVISDELNHASIIDGIRLCKATRYRYKNRDMADLEAQLVAAKGARRTLIVTDGVFSMDGSFAPLPEICDLAEKYDALVMVDDSHAIGFIGANGAGTPELFGVRDRVDILSGTLGKALGGASGGYISAHQEIVDLLRQRARPYLFSNSIPPTVVAGSLVALDLVAKGGKARETLQQNAKRFRDKMAAAGFTLLPGEHPIVPVMFSDEHEAVRMASALFGLGIYVVAFSYPVVPMGKARIRVQICATHTSEDIDKCVAAFIAARDQR
ncbi:MAG: glycine C-acetyltransferase [Actinobacteria bacterium]|jgi:glycine C-acetyltransferase|nr:glycine C-acetyltransferase [Actinomycetota bacterium]NCZ89683.1 glycine C-acetyltransferase [Actinomycetota bacterium]NCZ92757.1 glycine C-acetyltransferase [Actinomycetota bacterium]